MPSSSHARTLALCAAAALLLAAPPATAAPPEATPGTDPAPPVLHRAQPSSALRDALSAAPETESECDTIAALRLPFSSTTAVHERPAEDWNRGVAVCEAEVRAHPGEMRFLYQLGRAQYRLKNYPEALRDYKAVVDAGYTEAMVDLGVMYYYGQAVLQNYQTAIAYFTKAADAGSNRALANLAGMYADGLGVPKDDAKSLDLAEKAVEAGNPLGLKMIAIHYFNGAGVPRDYKMAAQYLQQASDLGEGQSMKFLANMYEAGYLGPPDPTKAAELRLRAQRLDPASQTPPPLPPLAQTAATRPGTPAPRRPYVVYRYNPAWQAAPGDTSCCPNNMLVCPLGRHFCSH